MKTLVLIMVSTLAITSLYDVSWAQKKLRFTGSDIKNNSLTGRDIKNSSITGADIKNNSLRSVDIKDGTIQGVDIADGAISASKLSSSNCSADQFLKYNGSVWVCANQEAGGGSGSQGPQGEQGPIGPQGSEGPQGPQGLQGETGPQGPQGPAGTDGKTVLYGATDPGAGTGNDGDFYINTISNTIFGPKASGSWPAGTSLVGPQGEQGPPGDGGLDAEGNLDLGAGALTAENITATGSVSIGATGLKLKGGPWIDVTHLDFGAVGDGSTDDLAAIQAAFAYAETLKSSVSKPTVYFPPASGYAISQGVTLGTNINLIMDGKLLYTGSSDEPALTIGANTENTENCRFKLMVERKNQSDWLSENNIGIRLVRINTCEIELGLIRNFTIGVQCHGDSGGFVYNLVRLGALRSNKYALDLVSTNNGWVNENIFFNGRFSVITGVGSGKARYGVRVRSSDGTYTNNNNNNFIKPSFELNSAGGGGVEAIPVLMENGMLNQFLEARSEGNSTIFARVSNNSDSNRYETAYGTNTIEYDSTASYRSDTILMRRNVYRLEMKPIFSSGFIPEKIVHYDATNFHIAGLHLASSSNVSMFRVNTNITVTPEYIEPASTRGIGIVVDTNSAKEFFVTTSVMSGYPGRIGVRCYDANGNVLDSSGPNHPYVRGTAATPGAYLASFGNIYRLGSDSSSFRFTVLDDVKSIVVLFMGGTNPIRLKSFTIYSPSATYAKSGYTNIPYDGANVATQAPNKGAHIYSSGRLIYNAVPASGQPQGWQVVNRKATTVSGDEAAGQTAISVADASTIQNGDIVAILLDSGTWHETAVNGAPVGNDVTITDALPSQTSNGAKFYANRWIALPSYP